MLRAIQSFFAGTDDGAERFVREGDLIEADDPFVVGKEHLFRDEAAPVPSPPSFVGVETTEPEPEVGPEAEAEAPKHGHDGEPSKSPVPDEGTDTPEPHVEAEDDPTESQEEVSEEKASPAGMGTKPKRGS